eukprot:gene6033-biopygen6065
MDRSLCRKLSKRWHGPLAVTERFYSDMQAGLLEADRGAPPAIPKAVIVDEQREAHVDRIMARRVGISRGKEIVKCKCTTLRCVVESNAVIQQALLQWRQVPHWPICWRKPWEEEFEDHSDECLPWEQRGMTSEGEVTYVTTLAAIDTRPVRILVLFSGTGSVEREFARCFPTSRSVTLDADPLWRPPHVTVIESWDYWRYPPGYFDVVWASPPCTQYSQARTTGGPPDFVTADACVQRTSNIIEYLQPQH